MPELIKEERYILRVGTEEHVLRVQQLLQGSTPWSERFRIELPASRTRNARKFYGTTAREVVDLAVEFLSSKCLQRQIAALPDLDARTHD